MAKNIYAELARIQQELKAPKNLYNKFGNYHYRNAEGILEAVKPLLNGLALVINDEPVMVGERYYIKATVTLIDPENGAGNVSAVAYAREDGEKKGMDGCQLTGACSSYARKYALNALLLIDDSKDSDDDSLSPKNPKNQENEKKPQSQPMAARNASVTTSGTVPPAAAPVPPAAAPEPEKKPEPSPVTLFLLGEIKKLREARGLTPAKNNKLFAEQRQALISEGLAPDKNLEKYTMEEAQALIEAMYQKFSPEGTEIKK